MLVWLVILVFCFCFYYVFLPGNQNQKQERKREINNILLTVYGRDTTCIYFSFFKEIQRNLCKHNSPQNILFYSWSCIFSFLHSMKAFFLKKIKLIKMVCLLVRWLPFLEILRKCPFIFLMQERDSKCINWKQNIYIYIIFCRVT